MVAQFCYSVWQFLLWEEPRKKEWQGSDSSDDFNHIHWFMSFPLILPNRKPSVKCESSITTIVCNENVHQDELEEDILLHSVAGHLQFMLSILQSSPMIQVSRRLQWCWKTLFMNKYLLVQHASKIVWRMETAILLATLFLLLLTLNR